MAGSCRHEYHPEHGCGMAVLCGSSYAAHTMGCSKSPAFVLRATEVDAVTRLRNKDFAPWEAPANNCPICWHQANKSTPLVTLEANDGR